MNNKLKTMLGFAKKAGKLSSGEGITLEQIKRGKALVVFLASDAGPSTAKRIKDKAQYRGIPVVEVLNRTEIGAATGIRERVVVSITDEGFAKSVKTILGGSMDEEN